MERPSLIFLGLLNRMWWLFPDKLFLQLKFRLEMGKRLDLKNPKTFNEKLQWLKLYNRKPEYTTMVDKYAVKEYVAGIIGEEYIIPTLGVWDKPEQIEWDKLPDQFVLKTTHGGGGGGVVICKDKNSFDKKKAIDKLNQSLKSDIYHTLREWPYKNVRKRIIAEKYMEDGKTKDLKDYKFFCFDGEEKYYKIDWGRFKEHHANYYDKDGNLMDCGESLFPRDLQAGVQQPMNLEEMKQLAERIAANLPFGRVDFYEVNGKTYFGEITFFPASGFEKLDPMEWDEQLGVWINLPTSMGGANC